MSPASGAPRNAWGPAWSATGAGVGPAPLDRRAELHAERRHLSQRRALGPSREGKPRPEGRPVVRPRVPEAPGKPPGEVRQREH